jgi:DNA-binding response OmpR family regulator
MRVYLIEDDPEQAKLVIEGLKQLSYEVEHFAEPQRFFHNLQNIKSGTFLVDWRLPGMSGYEVLIAIRQKLGADVPLIMLTGVDDENKIVSALEAGADDYILKPASMTILHARIQAVCRRLQKTDATRKTLAIDPYFLDLSKQSVTRLGDPIPLTPREFDLAWKFFSIPETFVSKQELWTSIWGKSSDIDQHTMVQHICNLRRKMQLDAHGFKLSSIYGAGYRLRLATKTENAA